MYQTLVVLFIVALCAFFIGRRLYRQIRDAADPDKDISCGCATGCASCSSSKCPDKEQKH